MKTLDITTDLQTPATHSSVDLSDRNITSSVSRWLTLRLESANRRLHRWRRRFLSLVPLLSRRSMAQDLWWRVTTRENFAWNPCSFSKHHGTAFTLYDAKWHAARNGKAVLRVNSSVLQNVSWRLHRRNHPRVPRNAASRSISRQKPCMVSSMISATGFTAWINAEPWPADPAVFSTSPPI